MRALILAQRKWLGKAADLAERWGVAAFEVTRELVHSVRGCVESATSSVKLHPDTKRDVLINVRPRLHPYKEGSVLAPTDHLSLQRSEL